MKFLTDENIGFKIINPLRKNGFDIQSILETNPGVDDVRVLSIANTEGTLMLLSEDLKHKLNRAYARVGKVNTFVNLLANTRPEGNAFAEAQNRLHATIIESELPIGETLGSLKQFLSTDRDS